MSYFAAGSLTSRQTLSQSKNSPLRFPPFLLIPVFIIGGGFYAIPYQITLETMDLMTAVCGVFIAAFFFSIPGAWIHRENFELGKKTMLGIVAVAICGIAGNYALCRALENSSATLFIVIARTEIIIAMILGWILLNEKVSLRFWVGVIIVMGGVTIMKSDGLAIPADALLPVMWASGCAFAFGMIQVISKSIIHLIDPQVLNVCRLFLASSLLLVSTEVRDQLAQLSFFEWSMIALAAFFGPFMGRVAYTYSLKYLTIAKAMLLGMFSPVLTLLLEYQIYGMMISPTEIGGSLMIFLGILWSFLPPLMNSLSENHDSKETD